MTIQHALPNKDYVIENITIDDESLKDFLFSLGCYEGENITVIHQRKTGCIVAIKDARYNIDKNLAANIYIKEI